MTLVTHTPILHLDMDAFYASVEQRDDPRLRGRPIVVGGSPNGRGVVSAASYEARKFGIRSAMPSSQALRRCPQLIFVRSNFDKYIEVSRQIRKIFAEVSNLVEPLSLDEAYIDLRDNKLGIECARQAAVYLKSRVRGSTGLTVSAGGGPNKFIAKLASDYDKPNGLVIVPPEKVDRFILPMPVERLWGVGPATAKRLHKAGLQSIADVRQLEKLKLQQLLGRSGGFLWELSHGRDPRQVHKRGQAKSRGCERTFAQDLKDLSELKSHLRQQAREVAQTLASRQLPGRTISIKVRYDDFSTISRSKTLTSFTMDEAVIESAAAELLEQTEAGQRPVRLLGVSVSNLWSAESQRQIELTF